MASLLKNIRRKLSREKNLPEDPFEIVFRLDDNEDPIIDLVDSLEEDSFTSTDLGSDKEEPTGGTSEQYLGGKTEKGLESDGETVNELEDKLDEESIEGDVWKSARPQAGEHMTDKDLEESLLELFESSESFASELVEQRQETGKKDEEIPSAAKIRPGDRPVNLQIAAEAVKEKNTSGKRPEPEDAIRKNLFVDIKLDEGPLEKKAVNVEPTVLRRESEMTTDQMAWIGSDQYYPTALQAFDRKIEEFEKEIERLLAQKEESKRKYECVRSILYLKDEKLKNAVEEIFTDYWSVKVSHMDKTKRAEFRENILLEHNGSDILIKIKGTSEDSPSIKYIAEVWKDLYYSELGTSVEGALVLNYGLEKHPKERNLAYEEDKEQLEDLSFVDTRVLYNLTAAIIDGDLTIEEAKRILFTKGRVEYNKLG